MITHFRERSVSCAEKNIMVLLILLLIISTPGCQSSNLLTFSGTIEGKEIPVRTQVDGEIIFLMEEGDEITPGDALAKIDDKSLQW